MMYVNFYDIDTKQISFLRTYYRGFPAMIECIDKDQFPIEIKFILKQKSFHITNIERERHIRIHMRM
jgi:hypothetical protein